MSVKFPVNIIRLMAGSLLLGWLAFVSAGIMHSWSHLDDCHNHSATEEHHSPEGGDCSLCQGFSIPLAVVPPAFFLSEFQGEHWEQAEFGTATVLVSALSNEFLRGPPRAG